MSFKPNEILVRDDAKYPAGAIVVDGYDPQGNLLAHPLGGGFQLIIPPTDHSRFDMVPDEERTPIFTRTKFSFEGLDESFTGWTDGKNWNGWAMPRFEFADAQRLIAALGQDGGKYDPGTEAFITTMEASEPENWSAENIHLPDGGILKVYPIGAGSWIWEQEDGS